MDIFVLLNSKTGINDQYTICLDNYIFTSTDAEIQNIHVPHVMKFVIGYFQHYVPRSSPAQKAGPYRPQAPRRHTTQVESSHVKKATGYVNVVSSAGGVRKPTPSRGTGRRSLDSRPRSPAGKM